ncbi:MAG: Pyridoxamine 5'-phosphate oxidase [candidate division WS6 bacterium OLB20]|uniref:Pyridoxamine 5'-phosphate oxidase n=1 Tax=candidate division WS6 bacterium OLB20 TaxID=1617426 RepID=A0A136M007_9BACT|nr:MAG: Pyridoxamine 5'-phosphate oxidase [candidate division WS6 bacterium OLB20]
MENGKQLAAEYLRSNKIGVLCTVTPQSTPHATLVYYLYEDEFMMYFVTKEQTAKARNIEANPNVAIVVGIIDEPVTAQCYGKAQRISGEGVIEKTNRILSRAHEGNYHWPPILDIKAGDPAVYQIEINRVQFYDEREVDLPENNYVEFEVQR